MKTFSENLKSLEDIFNILRKDLLSIDLTETYINKAEDIICELSKNVEIDNLNDEKFLTYEESLKTLESFKKKLVLKRIGELSDIDILLEKEGSYNKLDENNRNNQKNIHEEIEKEIKIELEKIKDKDNKSIYSLIKNLWKKIF